MIAEMDVSDGVISVRPVHFGGFFSTIVLDKLKGFVLELGSQCWAGCPSQVKWKVWFREILKGVTFLISRNSVTGFCSVVQFLFLRSISLALVTRRLCDASCVGATCGPLERSSTRANSAKCRSRVIFDFFRLRFSRDFSDFTVTSISNLLVLKVELFSREIEGDKSALREGSRSMLKSTGHFLDVSLRCYRKGGPMVHCSGIVV